jgi:hypothetical protein
VQTLPVGNGQLRVTITVQAGAGLPSNSLLAIQWGQYTNAVVQVIGEAGGQMNSINGGGVLVPGQQLLIPSGLRTTFTAGTQSVTLLVTRTTPGQPVIVPFTVFDGCGSWPTFVGGGPSAF